MFIIRLLRYIQGYIHFVATGGFTERFLNLCARSGIGVWGVAPKSDYEMQAQTLAKNYRRMRPLARRSGVKLKVERKIGAPFIVHRYRRRWGLPLAAGIFVALLIFMSGFIWSIEIDGDLSIDGELVRAQLDSIGIHEGTWKRSIDPREAAREMMLLNDEISWIALNIVGSTIHVELSERTMPPDVIDEEGTPTNVIASHTGQIKYMEVYDGQKVLNVGDTVIAGEIIVSGITEDQWGNTMLKHSRALVRAWTDEQVVITSPFQFSEKTYTGEVITRKSISLFGFELPLSLKKWPDQYDEAVTRRNLRVFGRALPFTVISREVQPYTYVPVTLTEAEARDRAMRELNDTEAQRYGGEEATVIGRQAVGTLEDGAFVIVADYVIERDIAVVSEIFVDQ